MEFKNKRFVFLDWVLWLKPVILATWEAVIGRIEVEGQAR
jgi:hypothetical protein